MLRFDKMRRWSTTAIIAHRGSGHRGPAKTTHENTLEAFEAAIQAGADAIELDLRRTADGIIIVHHEAGPQRSRRLWRDMTWVEIQQYAQRRGHAVGTIEETLKLCAGRIALDIELKEAGYENEVLALTRRYYDNSTVAFTSFDASTIRRIKRVDTRAITGLIVGAGATSSRGGGGDTLAIRRARRCGADFIAPDWRLLESGDEQTYRRSGFPLIVWTVNNRARGRRLIAEGFTGIITDFPEIMLPLA